MTRRAAVPVAAILAAFAATRLALFWRFPPFWDEALYASWALRVHDHADERFIAIVNGKLPLLTWLGSGLIAAGIEPLTAVRLISLAAGAASLALAAALAAELGARQAAACAAIAYVLLPLALVHDVIGIMEPLTAALLVLALYLQIRLARHASVSTALLLGLVLGAGLLTKETGRLAVVLLPASLLVFDWSRTRLPIRFVRWLGGAVVALLVAGVAYLVVTLSDAWPQYGSVQASFGTVRSLRAGLAHPLGWLEQEWPGYQPQIFGYLTPTLALVALAGVAIGFRRQRRVALLYLAWIVSLFVVDVLFLSASYVRYIVPAAPLVAVFVGVAVPEIARLGPRLWPGRLVVPAVGVVLAALGGSAVWFDARVLANPDTAPYPGFSRVEYATGWPAGSGWHELGAELERQAATRSIVVTWFGHLSYALPLQLRHDSRITITDSTTARQTSAFAITNGDPLPANPGEWTLRPIWTFQRPTPTGAPLTLYTRGITWQGRFFGDPTALRAGLNLDDHAFDRFIATHPGIRAWYMTMSTGPG